MTIKFSFSNKQFTIDFNYFIIKTSSEYITTVKRVYWDSNCIMIDTGKDIEILGIYSLLLSGDFSIEYREPFELTDNNIKELLNTVK